MGNHLIRTPAELPDEIEDQLNSSLGNPHARYGTRLNATIHDVRRLEEPFPALVDRLHKSRSHSLNFQRYFDPEDQVYIHLERFKEEARLAICDLMDATLVEYSRVIMKEEDVEPALDELVKIVERYMDYQPSGLDFVGGFIEFTKTLIQGSLAYKLREPIKAFTVYGWMLDSVYFVLQRCLDEVESIDEGKPNPLEREYYSDAAIRLFATMNKTFRMMQSIYTGIHPKENTDIDRQASYITFPPQRYMAAVNPGGDRLFLFIDGIKTRKPTDWYTDVNRVMKIAHARHTMMKDLVIDFNNIGVSHANGTPVNIDYGG